MRRFETVLAKVIWRNAAKLSYFGKTSAKTPFPGHQIPSPADNHPSKVPEVSVPVISNPLFGPMSGLVGFGRIVDGNAFRISP